MGERKYRLLIADDEENILNGMRRYIEKHTEIFERIDCAQDGQEALDLIYRYHPDIMLLDVQMPIKSGMDVMKEATKAGVCPKTIILSGYDSFIYAQQALRFGAVDYLLKPCRSTEILEKLESIADKIRKQEQAEQAVLQSDSGEKEQETEGEKEKGNHLVRDAVEYMKEHLAEELSLSGVAEQIGISPAYLSTLFGQQAGSSFVDYLNKLRIDCACQYMYDRKMKVYEIAFKVGFRDEKYFSKVFRKVTGVSPSDYRNGID